MNINISILDGQKKIAAQKDALEAARLSILRAHDIHCVNTRGRPHMMYCDSCPISTIGHGASKTLTREQSKLICPQRREYSK